ncbi:MAG: prepilin-type N-terminal cleavage/methylation domain-containing protein [Aeromonas sobria]|uniref:prepilin-type N-terminal cleavage/methylation domain-containing protein n=1 Tax=Aeromonas sobria TaxID=646 RepID=UPI0026EDED70|nr:prepilin-type N-terminal cleavage/methylation domain-containing protein [Aeromonas sobria]
MKKQAGFTLIELVIVIIILGILAVTAAPKFLNLQDDARYSAAQGVQAALQSSANLVYSKAALEGIESASSAQKLDGLDKVEVIFGYPTAKTISEAVTLEGWSVSGADGTFVPDNGAGNNCSVVYTEADATTKIFSTKIEGCAKP